MVKVRSTKFLVKVKMSYIYIYIEREREREREIWHGTMRQFQSNQFHRGNVQNSLAKELYIVSYTTFKTINETSISSFRNSRSILELEWARVKMPHRSRVFKTRVLSKKNFTYSGVFKPYSDVLMPYSGVFLQKIL